MLSCVYHPTLKMRVVEEEVKAKMVASGEWFNTSADMKKHKETKDEQNNVQLESTTKRKQGRRSSKESSSARTKESNG